MGTDDRTFRRKPAAKRGRAVSRLRPVVALSLGTDQVLHVLGVYPPWNVPMRDPGLNLLALAYRSVYAVLGGALFRVPRTAG